jgi:hypothetical protein
MLLPVRRLTVWSIAPALGLDHPLAALPHLLEAFHGLAFDGSPLTDEHGEEGERIGFGIEICLCCILAEKTN